MGVATSTYRQLDPLIVYIQQYGGCAPGCQEPCKAPYFMPHEKLPMDNRLRTVMTPERYNTGVGIANAVLSKYQFFLSWQWAMGWFSLWLITMIMSGILFPTTQAEKERQERDFNWGRFLWNNISLVFLIFGIIASHKVRSLSRDEIKQKLEDFWCKNVSSGGVGGGMSFGGTSDYQTDPNEYSNSDGAVNLPTNRNMACDLVDYQPSTRGYPGEIKVKLPSGVLPEILSMNQQNMSQIPGMQMMSGTGQFVTGPNGQMQMMTMPHGNFGGPVAMQPMNLNGQPSGPMIMPVQNGIVQVQNGQIVGRPVAQGETANGNGSNMGMPVPGYDPASGAPPQANQNQTTPGGQRLSQANYAQVD